MGWCAFARHYLRNRWFTFFSSGYLDVSVPRVRPCFAGAGIASGGLPHSEIHGSGDICSSPWLIAACHVLRRLREPRHPSCALVTFLYDLGDAMSHCMASVLDPHRIRRSRTSVRSSGGVIAAMPSFLDGLLESTRSESHSGVLLACVDSILDLAFSLCLFDLPAPSDLCR